MTLAVLLGKVLAGELPVGVKARRREPGRYPSGWKRGAVSGRIDFGQSSWKEGCERYTKEPDGPWVLGLWPDDESYPYEPDMNADDWEVCEDA